MTLFGGWFARRSGRVIAVTTAGALLATAAAEGLVRHRTTGRFADGVHRKIDARPEVRLGAEPVLLQLAQGELARVQVSADDATFRGVSGVSFAAELRHVERAGGRVSVKGTHASADVPNQALARLVAEQRGGTPTVTADPATGTLIVHTGPAGMVQVSMRPRLTGSQVTLEPVSTSIAGRPLPGLTDRLTSQARTVDLSGLPLRLAPTSVAVTPQGLHLRFTGQHATFSA